MSSNRPARREEQRACFRDLYAAEGIKLFAQRSTFVLLALALLISVGGAWFSTSGVHLVDATARADYDRLRGAFNEGIFALLSLVAGVLGTLTMVGEFAGGLIRTTFIAVPDRRRVVLAKAAVLVSVTGCAGLLGATASYLTTQSVLGPKQLGIPFTDSQTWHAFLASALLLPVSAVVGMCVGTLIRTPVAACFITFAAESVLANILPSDSSSHLVAALSDAIPRNAWDGLVTLHTADDPAVPFPPGAFQCWAALLAWPVLALLLTLLVVRRRDV